MIRLEDIALLNEEVVTVFGGAGVGFKDENLAQSLIPSLNQEVFGEKLYPTIYDKISFLVFSIIANHVFIDGNKRTGILVLEITCYKNNLTLTCSEDDLVQLALDVDDSKMNKDDVKDWIFKNTIICLEL